MAALQLYNSLTRQLEPFAGPRDGATVRIYTCGPTVYAYQHIGNMRAFLFADTLGRTLRWLGFATRHVINITDVGHLTSDADTGDDKMERAAAAQAKSIWDIAAHYTDAFKADVARLNIEPPAAWTVATDHIAPMIAFAQVIERNGNAYALTERQAPGAAGLYFDVATLGGRYGQLARAETEAAESGITEGRIDLVEGKRNAADFALWRTSPPGEQRQMEWDSPWGRGAPGWHLECSVMSLRHLGHPFDIHTGGIDHREIHHPNEIAQNQAYCGCDDSGAAFWLHNNFLVDRTSKGVLGKMSKSSGGFLTLQTLVDRGVHPLAYRLLCLQAHYRSELEFTWEGLGAALTRLKRMILGVQKLKQFIEQDQDMPTVAIGPDDDRYLSNVVNSFRAAMSDDLNTAQALVGFEGLALNNVGSLVDNYPDQPARVRALAQRRLTALQDMDRVLGLDITTLARVDLRVRPLAAAIDVPAIEARLGARRDARAARDFARSDLLREELTAAGVEVMDGDPLGWDWKLSL